MKRDRKRLTRVGPLTWAPRITSSSAMVCEICSATTPAARSPMASITPCAASLSRPPANATQAMWADITINMTAATANKNAMNRCSSANTRRRAFKLTNFRLPS